MIKAKQYVTTIYWCGSECKHYREYSSGSRCLEALASFRHEEFEGNFPGWCPLTDISIREEKLDNPNTKLT